MGSFTEATLGFSFRPDVPTEVLAAFSALAPDPQPDWPPLPPAVEEPVQFWAPDYDAVGHTEPDPFADRPWLHDWASWFRSAMGIQTTPHARLEWSETDRWYLSCRFSFKTDAEGVFEFLRWLGPFIDRWDDDEQVFVGTLHYEYDERPHLLWCSGGELRLESLEKAEEPRPDPLPGAGRLVIVTGLPGSGKSTYLRSVAERSPHSMVIDDYQADSHLHLTDPRASRHFSALVAAVSFGRTVVVSDIRFCDSAALRGLAALVMSAAPFTLLSVRAFENDPPACEANIRNRGTDVDFHLQRLEEYAPRYQPIGEVVPVAGG